MTALPSALNTLEIAIAQIKNAGIEVSIAPLYNASTQSIAIIIPGVKLVDGKLEKEETP